MDLQKIAQQIRPHVVTASDMIIDAWEKHHFDEKQKDERDIVTSTDIAVEDFLRTELAKIIPEAGFIVEEGITDRHGELNWAIDPIDGTKYFAHRVPMFYCQVALLQGIEPVISFVSQPIGKQMFHAIKGQGAYLNDVKLPLPRNIEFQRAIVEIDSGSLIGEMNKWKSEFLHKICGTIYRPRLTGGHLSIYLTTSAIDAAINIDIKGEYTNKNIVDLSPHKLIITEAGFEEALLSYEGHQILVWASPQHIEDIKGLIML